MNNSNESSELSSEAIKAVRYAKVHSKLEKRYKSKNIYRVNDLGEKVLRLQYYAEFWSIYKELFD